jgi:hypothetical protein
MYEPTKFTEANALLATQAGELAAVRDKLSGMYDSELRELELASDKLSKLCHEERQQRLLNIIID